MAKKDEAAKKDQLEGVATGASAEGLDIEVADVKVNFIGTAGFLEDAPKLGEPVTFQVSGFVRLAGKEFIEKDESDREFVQVKVTGMKRID